VTTNYDTNYDSVGTMDCHVDIAMMITVLASAEQYTSKDSCYYSAAWCMLGSLPPPPHLPPDGVIRHLIAALVILSASRAAPDAHFAVAAAASQHCYTNIK
jgi:hypothetical protein